MAYAKDGAEGASYNGLTKSVSRVVNAITAGTTASQNSATDVDDAKAEQRAARTISNASEEDRQEAYNIAGVDYGDSSAYDATEAANTEARNAAIYEANKNISNINSGNSIDTSSVTEAASSNKTDLSSIDLSSIDTSRAGAESTALTGTSSSDAIAGTMGDQYKVEDSDEYSWNKIAAQMGQLYYDQEAQQALYESVEAKSTLDTEATSAWNNYWAQEYSARQTQDKMGWTGGAKTASDLQTAFLQAEAASNMYTNYDLQKYGVDSKLSIARMYAEQQQDSLAQQYYQDAVSIALSEAEQTGYYISAENKELMTQYSVASDIINGKQSGDIDRAKSVKAACENAWDQQGFGKDADGNYIGVETLTNLEYQETMRSNQINEELQKMQVEIEKSQAESAWAEVEVAAMQVEVAKAQIEAEKIIAQNQLNAMKA